MDPHRFFCFFLLTADLKGEAEGGCSHVIWERQRRCPTRSSPSCSFSHQGDTGAFFSINSCISAFTTSLNTLDLVQLSMEVLHGQLTHSQRISKMNILCPEAKHLSILGSASQAPSRECTQFTKAVMTSFLQSSKAPSLITHHMACSS